MKTDSLVTEEMILLEYMKARPDLGEKVVREIWRNLKDFAKQTVKKDKVTRLKIGRNITLFSDMYLKGTKDLYEGEDLQYLMNSLYSNEYRAYDPEYLMNIRYRENNIEEIVEDVENFFKNPPFKTKKRKQ